MNRHQVLGVNDDRDFCECCGKTGLKKVVWIQDNETSEVKHFGVVCASKPSKGFNLDKEIKHAARRHEDYLKALNYVAHRHYKARGGQYVKSNDWSWKAADESLYQSCLKSAKAERFNF